MAAAIMILCVLMMAMAAACLATEKAHRDEILKIRHDIDALQSANEAPRPAQPPTVDFLYPENGPAYNVRD